MIKFKLKENLHYIAFSLLTIKMLFGAGLGDAIVFLSICGYMAYIRYSDDKQINLLSVFEKQLLDINTEITQLRTQIQTVKLKENVSTKVLPNEKKETNRRF